MPTGCCDHEIGTGVQSMTDKKHDFETACAAAVKARNFTEAASVAYGAEARNDLKGKWR